MYLVRNDQNKIVQSLPISVNNRDPGAERTYLRAPSQYIDFFRVKRFQYEYETARKMFYF